MDLVFRVRVEANGAALTTTAIIWVITPAMSGFMVRTRLVGLVAALIIIIPRALIAPGTVGGRMFGNAGLVLIVPSPITRASLVLGATIITSPAIRNAGVKASVRNPPLELRGRAIVGND